MSCEIARVSAEAIEYYPTAFLANKLFPLTEFTTSMDYSTTFIFEGDDLVDPFFRDDLIPPLIPVLTNSFDVSRYVSNHPTKSHITCAQLQTFISAI